MTIEEAIKAVKEIAGMSLDWDDQHYEALQMAIEALSAEAVQVQDGKIKEYHVGEIPDEWKIPSDAELCKVIADGKVIAEVKVDSEEIIERLKSEITDCTEFLLWLVDVVLDDEDWALNAVAYGEIIARKLKKLGLLETKDGYYIRPSAEAVQVVRCKECRWYKVGENEVDSWSICGHPCMDYRDVCGDDFCSWAERRGMNDD